LQMLLVFRSLQRFGTGISRRDPSDHHDSDGCSLSFYLANPEAHPGESISRFVCSGSNRLSMP
jgi:hypothetical protein